MIQLYRIRGIPRGLEGTRFKDYISIGSGAYELGPASQIVGGPSAFTEDHADELIETLKKRRIFPGVKYEKEAV
jgi:hypothetical protein